MQRGVGGSSCCCCCGGRYSRVPIHGTVSLAQVSHVPHIHNSSVGRVLMLSR
jgi:hypothetical protein